MTQNPPPQVIEELEAVLADQGVHVALALLNRRTRHRFTGVYRLDPPTLRSVRLFDRENPWLEIGNDAPLLETYCSITGEHATSFATEDARVDQRLQGHPARETTLSYCGVPIRGEGGEAVGTLCHFDVVPQPIPLQEVSVLEAAAPRILRALREAGEFPAAG